MKLPLSIAALVLTVLACTPAPPMPPVAATSAPPPTRGGSTATTEGDSGAAECAANQFVACESGEACATRQGKLIHPKACHEHAASACASLACEHGCNIHHGTPKLVLCAVNESGSSHMERCGGFSNWACPEDMECQVDAKGFDVIGRCVPAKRSEP